MDRRWLVGIGVAAVALAILLHWRPARSPEPPAPAPEPLARAPEPPPASTVRHPLPRPLDLGDPELPDRRPEPAPLTPDLRREMNFAMDGVIREARKQCLQPLVDAKGASEFVFDAVLWDGRLVDFGVRSLGVDVPEDVLACVADAVWYGDWPEWDLAGELRLQRAIEVEPK